MVVTEGVGGISRTCSLSPPISPNEMMDSPSSFMWYTVGSTWEGVMVVVGDKGISEGR